MPDRYGETTDPDTTDPDTTPSPRLTRAALVQAAIRECDLCDQDGYQGGIVCHHEDFRPAARRGIAAVREAMGWSQ